MTPGMSRGPDLVLLVFSPQGHILVLAGFGNLQGQMEVWDMKKYKQVCVLLRASSWWGRVLLLLWQVWGGQTLCQTAATVGPSVVSGVQTSSTGLHTLLLVS